MQQGQNMIMLDDIANGRWPAKSLWWLIYECLAAPLARAPGRYN
jgi:hypothetical protein